MDSAAPKLATPKRKRRAAPNKAAAAAARPVPRAADLPQPVSAPAHRPRLSLYRRGLLALHRLVLDRRGPAPERVSTAGEAELAGLRVVGPHAGLGHPYAPSPRAVLRWAIEALPEPADNLVFLDIGAGRGRVLLEAARWPFRSIVGVEFAEELHDDAAMNLRHWPRSLMACRDVDVVLGDAADFELPDADLVVYMFDPFAERMMTRIAARLAEHGRRRRVYVILVEAGNTVVFRESPAFAAIEMPRPIARRFRCLSPYACQLFMTAPRF